MGDYEEQRLPDADSATVDDAKFTRYLLNDAHPVGRGKAKFFKRHGFDQSNWQELKGQIVTKVTELPARYSRENGAGGQNYEVIVPVASSTGTVNVRTFWEVHPVTGTRFLTAYPED